MTSILKTLIGKTRKTPSPEDVEALERATQVLQFRVAQMTKPAATDSGKAAA